MMNFRLKNKFISVGLSFMFCSVCLGFPKNFVQNGFSSYSASVFAGNVPADKVAPVNDIRDGVGEFFDKFEKYADLMESDFSGNYVSTAFPAADGLVKNAALDQKFVLAKIAPIRDFLFNLDNLCEAMNSDGYVDAYKAAGNKNTYVENLVKVGDDSTKLAKDIYNTTENTTGAALKGVDGEYSSDRAQATVSGEVLDDVLKTLTNEEDLKTVTKEVEKTKASIEYKSLVNTLTNLKKINFVILVKDINKVVDLFDADAQTDSKVNTWFDGKFEAAALTALLTELTKSENDNEILGENCITYVTNSIKKIIDLYTKDVTDVLTAKAGEIDGGITATLTDLGFFNFGITKGKPIAESFDRLFNDKGEDGKNLSKLDLKLVPYLIAVLDFFAHCLDVQKKALDKHYTDLTAMNPKIKIEEGEYGTKLDDTGNAFTVFCKNVYLIVQALKLLLEEPKKLTSTNLELEGDDAPLFKPIPLKSSLDKTIAEYMTKVANDDHLKDKDDVPDDFKDAVKKVEDAVKAIDEDLEKKSVFITTLLSNTFGCGLIMKSPESFASLLITPLATLTDVVGKKGNKTVNTVLATFVGKDDDFILKRAAVKDALNEYSKFRKPLARLIAYSNVVGSDAEKGKEALAANPILKVYNKCSLTLGNIITNSAAAFALDMALTTGLYQANTGVEKLEDMAGYVPGGAPKKKAPGKGYSRRRK